jgi:hypothetical protein
MIVTLSRIPAVTSAPKRSRRLRGLSLGVLFFFFQKRLLLFPRLYPPSKTLFFSFPAVISTPSKTWVSSFQDVVLLLSRLCFSLLRGLTGWRVWHGRGWASIRGHRARRQRRGTAGKGLDEVRLCLVSHYARCCLTYPKPLASQTPGQGFVVAITIWPERSRFSLLREYPSKPSAVASTSSRTTLLE